MIERTTEHVSEAHPDKFCDQVADSYLDAALRITDDLEERKYIRTAIECLAKDRLLIVSGEVNARAKDPRDKLRTKELRDKLRTIDVEGLARDVWVDVAYDEDGELLQVINHIRGQSKDIAEGSGKKSDKAGGANVGGAGDQGIMVGYATDQTDEFMPREWVLAHDLCRKLQEMRKSKKMEWLRSDCKTQVTVGTDGLIRSVIVAAQHRKKKHEDIEAEVTENIIYPLFDGMLADDCRISVNGTGAFEIGGPIGDSGVVGRKIVVDAYGPRVPVGGGAYSGKDPSKVDRSAAYMARHIAKKIVRDKVKGAKECTVTLAYGIGQFEPEMITAITETGEDLEKWVRRNFTDLSPRHIIEYLQLLHTDQDWSYYKTASYGHYGRDIFPWERDGDGKSLK